MKRAILLAVMAMASLAGVMNKVAAADNRATVTALSDADFRAKIYDYVKSPGKWNFKGDRVAVIDFYADWCGPCRQVAPLIETLAGEYGDRIAVFKVNVDDAQQTAAFFRINAIPLVMVIPVSGEPTKLLGARGEDAYKAAIDKALAK